MKQLVLALAWLFLGNPIWGQSLPNSLALGVQGGLALPAGDDLRITTGPGLNLTAGIHATWALDASSTVRPRLDLLSFAAGHQDASTPLVQHLDTSVQGVALGCEYLYRIQGARGRWAAGAGLYLIRWSVASSNQISAAGGVAQASGSSHWTRQGLGLVASCRIAPRLAAEARWISSHYGYQNLPARFGTLGLLCRI